MEPNFRKGVGRLATDEYNFRKHIDGTAFQHKASSLELFPPVSIEGTEYGSVQAAIAAISDAIVTPPNDDATTSEKGIVQLAGDIGGAATNVKVVGLQGFSVSTLTPTTNHVLTFNGSSWESAVSPSIFSAGTDLAGTNVAQTVIGITGYSFGGSTQFDMNCAKMLWAETITAPLISQQVNTTTNGRTLRIAAQTSSAGNGGTVLIEGGGGTGNVGGAALRFSSQYFIEGKFVTARVLSLMGSATITSSRMPADTGDMVIYIADAATPPGAGNPVDGSILYSENGTLNVKQEDGVDFIVGELRNPSQAGEPGQLVYTQRVFYQSTTDTAELLFTYPFPDDTLIFVEVSYTGKEEGTNASTRGNMHTGYVRNGGGAPALVGTLTYSDNATSGTASTWLNPEVDLSGNNIIVITGQPLTPININWLMVIKLQIVTAA